MRDIVNDIRLQFNGRGKPEVVLTISKNKKEVMKSFNKLEEILENNKLTVEIKKKKKKRSLNANNYMWVLCQKIAEVINSTKEIVYREMIQDVGQFEILPIKNNAVDTWIERWQSRGLGWIAEVLCDSRLDGYKKIINYYGSSVYNAKEISVLIDEIVYQAKELDIETLPPYKIKQLEESWENNEHTQKS